MKLQAIEANLIDIHKRQTYPARVEFENGFITSIQKIPSAKNYILPGFVDAHVHIESAMMVPSEFASLAVRHGTVATVSDPHEIANVLGVPGVDYMIENGNKTPFKFYFGAPSCVPATRFETAGATINATDILSMLARPEIKYLAEMMNWPGVLYQDKEVMAKIEAARSAGKPVDGHAPGLVGDEAKKYVEAGISTDHECFSLEEALGKIQLGMKILIREGSAAKNYEALHPIIGSHPGSTMFCSDDKHPDSLQIDHINELVKRSLTKGYDLYDVLRIASLHPVVHYGLDVGLLNEEDKADFIVVDTIENLKVLETYIGGECVFSNGRSSINKALFETPNAFGISKISSKDLRIQATSSKMRVIQAVDGSLITESTTCPVTAVDGAAVSNPDTDMLKMVVINRYEQAKPAIAFVQNFGLKTGAIASSVGHDSHNITAVGVDDEAIASAINLVIEQKGGISAVGLDENHILPLPVAGLMSALDGDKVAQQYTRIDAFAKQLGSTLSAPFMTLSFMSLLVIPDLKLSDQGLFSGAKFEFVDLFC